MDTARRRARKRESSSWCQSSLQHAGGWPSKRELVKQGLSERNGMIAFGRIRDRFGETSGVTKLSDVFQFQWTSPDSLDDKWLRWQRLMRQVNMTSLGDDARETPTIAGLEKSCVYVLHRPGQCCVQVWISTCERWRTRAFSQNCGIDFFHLRPLLESLPPTHTAT